MGKTYKIEIQETLSRIVYVEANNKNEAKNIVKENWDKGEFDRWNDEDKSVKITTKVLDCEN